MAFIIKMLQLICISILSIFYYPLNASFSWLQKHYRSWQAHDRTSFYIATPLYYLLFVLVVIVSTPLEALGEAIHPPLSGFK